MTPTPQFIQSVEANLHYWLQQIAHLNGLQFSELDADRQNIFRATQFGLTLPQTWESTAELAIQLLDFVETRGYWREWILVVKRALSIGADKSLYWRCKLMNSLGSLYRLDRQFLAAIDTYTVAQEIAIQLNDRLEEAYSSFGLSEVLWATRQYEKAERHGVKALEILNDLNISGRPLASTLSTLGLIAYARGEYDVAKERLTCVVSLERQNNRPTWIAQSLKNLAIIHESMGDFDLALSFYLEALEYLEFSAAELEKVKVRLSLGCLYIKADKLDEAESILQEANSPFLRQIGNAYYQAMVAHNLGNIFLSKEEFVQAETHLQKAVMLWRRVDDALMLANTLGDLAHALITQSNIDEAISSYDEAIALLDQYKEDNWGRQLYKKLTAARKNINITVRAGI